MAAPPVPYRVEQRKLVQNGQPNDQQQQQKYMPSFPPPIYYRDTFGLEPVDDHSAGLYYDEAMAESDDGSGTTKSTVRNTAAIHIFHPNASVPGPTTSKLPFFHQPRRKSGFTHVSSNNNQATMADSQNSQLSTLQSVQVEELVTDDLVLPIFHPRAFLWLCTIQMALLVQLLVFSIVCLFFDGHWFGFCLGIVLLANSITMFIFIRYKHTHLLMKICIFLATVNVLLSTFLFALSAYFIRTEDQIVDNEVIFDDHAESNKIVQNARVFMYILMLVYSPFCVICAVASLYILLRSCPNRKAGVHKGFFLSRSAGHQNVLVPIKLRKLGKSRRNEGASERGAGGSTTTIHRRIFCCL